MKSLKKPLMMTLVVIVSAIVLLTGFSVLTYNVNIQRLNNGEAPLFIFHTNAVNDGGTVIYSGVGYHIVKWKSFIENTPLEKNDFKEIAEMDIVYVCGWDIGFGRSWNTIQSGPSPEHTIDFHFE